MATLSSVEDISYCDIPFIILGSLRANTGKFGWITSLNSKCICSIKTKRNWMHETHKGSFRAWEWGYTERKEPTAMRNTYAWRLIIFSFYNEFPGQRVAFRVSNCRRNPAEFIAKHAIPSCSTASYFCWHRKRTFRAHIAEFAFAEGQQHTTSGGAYHRFSRKCRPTPLSDMGPATVDDHGIRSTKLQCVCTLECKFFQRVRGHGNLQTIRGKPWGTIPLCKRRLWR